VIILLNGGIREDARLADLEASSDAVVVLGESSPDVSPVLRTLHGVRSVEAERTDDGRLYRVRGTGKADLRPAIFELAREKGWGLKELRRDHRTLEMVFNELVTTAAVKTPSREEHPLRKAGGKAA
jgi:hypothetical protein